MNEMRKKRAVATASNHASGGDPAASVGGIRWWETMCGWAERAS